MMSMKMTKKMTVRMLKKMAEKEVLMVAQRRGKGEDLALM
jgi:hypothetical protein